MTQFYGVAILSEWPAANIYEYLFPERNDSNPEFIQREVSFSTLSNAESSRPSFSERMSNRTTKTGSDLSAMATK